MLHKNSTAQDAYLGWPRSLPLLAYERGVCGEAYLLGAHNSSLLEMARLALRIAGRNRPIFRLPVALAWAVAWPLLAGAWLSGRDPLVTPRSVRMAALGLEANAEKAMRQLGNRAPWWRASAMLWFGMPAMAIWAMEPFAGD